MLLQEAENLEPGVFLFVRHFTIQMPNAPPRKPDDAIGHHAPSPQAENDGSGEAFKFERQLAELFSVNKLYLDECAPIERDESNSRKNACSCVSGIA
jgi:hypothetical protein